VAYTRLPSSRFINHTLPAKMPVVGGSFVGPTAGEVGRHVKRTIEPLIEPVEINGSRKFF
jgi:hypothetical protein